ncbi:MAG TPA: M17 family peptidase N-terminal domain-containing protein [Phycisphaerae bacterium]|nr:M17 family peptidase N-terminal domain-containing protein [Phycisphaerae bacterium]
MRSKYVSILPTVAIGVAGFFAVLRLPSAPAQSLEAPPKVPEKSFKAANDLKITVRMIAPYDAETDLQIVCAFKHKEGGDRYIEAFQNFDDKLRGLLSSLRNRGEFAGDLGETILFNTWPASIAPYRVLVIGLGPEKDLSLDTLRTVGRVALREAVNLRAKDVAFAPVIRDQGNSSIDVGLGDRAIVEQIVLAYDTEKRLQSEGLKEQFAIHEWVIEAGPAFVQDAITKVGKGVDWASQAVKERPKTPYRVEKK